MISCDIKTDWLIPLLDDSVPVRVILSHNIFINNSSCGTMQIISIAFFVDVLFVTRIPNNITLKGTHILMIDAIHSVECTITYISKENSNLNI